MNDDLDLIEDRPQSALTAELVREGVEDWQNRLRDLFGTIEAWSAANGWRSVGSGSVSMHEDLMRRFDLPATEQPTLRLESERGYALFKPKGRWVIGANGRIDLYTPKGTFVIVDLARRGDPARWTIFRASSKRDGEAFEPEMLAHLI